jgi:hypothetical protein
MQKWVAGVLGFKQMEFMEGMLCVVRGKRKTTRREQQTGKQEGRQCQV